MLGKSGTVHHFSVSLSRVLLVFLIFGFTLQSIRRLELVYRSQRPGMEKDLPSGDSAKVETLQFKNLKGGVFA